MDSSTPGFPFLHYLLEFAQTDVHCISDANQVSHPLSSPFLPTLNISQTQGLFCESALRIRWTQFWSFSFSISPSNEYSGLISFRIDWFDVLAVQETLKTLPAPQFESINSLVLSLLYGPILTFIHIHT